MEVATTRLVEATKRRPIRPRCSATKGTTPTGARRRDGTKTSTPEAKAAAKKMLRVGFSHPNMVLTSSATG
jgi:hypothetical protein